ncbi:hypothetical protein UFOVP1382_83 [uncultured Caudovirales phage]|uniref:Uncharacterized protein n=1 Tax=uncultured Caudovirales phage TaxID=2100421 RepID=A0A6J5S3T8_9CAUD|nr:hypothetical protein UFOVP1382_83 [uncultured Caudovirales phage]
MSRRDREIITPLVEQINAVRREFGGCEFTEAQMRGFAFQHATLSREAFAKWLTGWRDAYQKAGPKLVTLGLTIDRADALWAGAPESGGGYGKFVEFVDRLLVEQAGR